MKNSILCFHQGSELYGSDKIFLYSVDCLKEGFDLTIVLDSYGPLVGKLNDIGIEKIVIMDLAVLRKAKVNSLRNGLRYVVDLVSASFRVWRLLKGTQPKFVYVNTLAVVSPLLGSTFLKNVNVIHHLHEIQRSPKIPFKILYTLSSLCSDRVLCVSEAVRDCFNEMSICKNSKVQVLHNGIVDNIENCNFEARKRFWQNDLEGWLGEDELLIAYVARIHTWKGQELFLEVVKLLVSNYGLKIKVAFFGDVYPGYEYLWETLEKKASLLNIRSNIKFFGFRVDADLLFHFADISIMGSTLPDPLPTVVLESMMHGTPVVGFSHGGTVEMVKDNYSGYLVSPSDVESMAERINSLALDGAKRQLFGENSRKIFLEKFSISAYRLALKRVFNWN